MQRDGFLSAVLILPDLLDFDPPLYWPAVKRALTELDSDDTQPATLCDDRLGIAGKDYVVRVLAEVSDEFGPTIRLILFAQNNARPNATARRLLRRIVVLALRDCEADFIFWPDGNRLLDRDEFAAFSQLPDPGSAEPEISKGARSRLTAASWMMTAWWPRFRRRWVLRCMSMAGCAARTCAASPRRCAWPVFSRFSSNESSCRQRTVQSFDPKNNPRLQQHPQNVVNG